MSVYRKFIGGAFNPSTGLRDGGGYQDYINGMASVATKKGTGQLTKNRNRSAVATTYAEATNTVTFTEADNVTHIEFMIKSNVAGAVQTDDACLVIYDGENEAIDTGFFADAGSINTDVMYEMVPFNTPIVRDFTSYLSRISFLSLTDAVRVTVKAQ